MVFWPRCCVCEASLSFALPWNTPEVRTCDWCFQFWESLAKQNKVHCVYSAQEYSPLDFYSQKSQNKDNYRNTFTAGPISCQTPSALNVIFRVQNSPDVKDVGGFFYKNTQPLTSALLAKRFLQHQFAILPEWNTMNAQIPFAVPPGVDMLVGIAAPHGAFKGGGNQIYIHPEVARLLYPASCEFLRNPNANTYKQFLKNAKPAIEMQEYLNGEFKIHQRIVHNEAHDYNALKKLRSAIQKIHELHSKPEELAQEYLKLERYVQETKLKDPIKNDGDNNPQGEKGWNKLCKFVLEQRANLQKDYSTMPYKTMEAAARCGDIRKNFKLGNMYNQLSLENQKALTKVKNLIGEKTPVAYTTRTAVNCGTFLIHKTEDITIEIIVNFLRTEKNGNVTTYYYNVLTLVTFFV